MARGDNVPGLIPADELLLASQCCVNVLITDASGDHRAAYARVIHDNSAHSNGPFVIARGRDESGRDIAPDEVDRWFERASGGSLLIDDVNRLGHEGQAQLFRRLERNAQDRAVESDAPVRKPVRVIAGASRALFAAIAAGRFSAALYYRLNLIHIDGLDRNSGGWLNGPNFDETPDMPDPSGSQAAFP